MCRSRPPAGRMPPAKPQPSHVLTAMGLDKKEINGAVRISFDRLTEEEDVIKAAEIIAKEVATIRRFM